MPSTSRVNHYSFSEDRIRITINNLEEQRAVAKDPITSMQYCPAEKYKENTPPPQDGYITYEQGAPVSGHDAHFWFRTYLHTPPAQEHKLYYLRFTTGKEGAWDATAAQGLIYLNGKIESGLDSNHTDVLLEANTLYEIHNYLYTGLSGDAVYPCAQLITVDDRIEQLWYDMQVPFEAMKTVPQETLAWQQVMSVLEQTANLIDMRSIHSDTYYDSIDCARSFIGQELYDKLCSTEGKPIVNCIGHTHIDVEWLWARAQTREKIERSFATASALMKQYPEYRFMLSQPELYRYLKEQAPDKYEELKALIQEGRWEPEGSMWLEADCNLISGESFIRQILHGKKFFQDEFGKDCKILFLPDVFGYSCALPQILKKCGVEHFVTSKISWNDTNKQPYDTFLWEGLDGTEIFTNFITTQNYTFEEPPCICTYVGMLSPSQIHGTWKRYQQKEYSDLTLTTFGFGDGGGGPTKQMLETQRRLAKGLPGMPVTTQEFLLPHLNKVREKFDDGCRRTGRTPRWVGELYLEFHRGTYTSVAKNKRNNRQSELLLNKAEALSYITKDLGAAYESDTLDACWLRVLHNQFHDIIPGSSINEVYEGTDKDYAEIRETVGGIIDKRLQLLADNTDAKGTFVYNPLGFARRGPVRVNGIMCETEDTVPAFGWQVFSSVSSDCHIQIDGLTAENDQYILTLDDAGRIARLYDKQNAREVFKSGQCGNEIQMFEDYPREHDNWEISEYYREKMWVLDSPAQIKPFFDGSSAGFIVTQHYMDSVIQQTIRLYSHSRRIDIEHEIDWVQKHQVMKLAFPFDVHATSATYEIQFGHVNRPTHHNTSWDAAKFEVYGHKWVDVSENGYGTALLNDCKYGHNADGSTLKLTVLKSGSYPNEKADIGHHTFTCTLFPHTGDFRNGNVIQEAYALNQPLTAVSAPGTGTQLPVSYSQVCCDRENIIVETIKKAQADDSMIVRLYDAYDRRTTATLTVAPGFQKAFLCDMLENEQEELVFDGTHVTLPVKNFEIVTVKFKA